MLGDNNVVATIAVKSLGDAKKFYEGVLGLKRKSGDDTGGIYYQSGNSGLFVYESQYAGTNQATYAGWSVEDIESTVEDLKNRGVKFEHYPDMPDVKLEGEIHSMGDTFKAAWFKDPDGNIFALDNQSSK